MKKIIFLLSSFFYTYTIIASLTETHHFIADQETSPAEKYIQSTLETNSAADQIYELLKKRSAIRNQLLQVYEKLPDKNIAPPAKESFTLSYVIGSTLLTGLVASPAFTINYLNKYITPTRYQDFIDKASLGLAGLIGAIGTFKVTKQGIKSTYDLLRYESIRKQIDELESKLRRTTGSINGIRREHSDLYDISNMNSYEILYKDFMTFYENNDQIITREKMNVFLSGDADITPSPSDDLLILKACMNMRNKLILSMEDSNISKSSWSTGNLTHDIILGIRAILIAPWIVLFSALDKYNSKSVDSKISSPYTRYKQLNEWENTKYKEIDKLDTIIKQLKTIVFETANV